MKDKLLKTDITKAVESLAKALRDYSGEPMYLRLTIFSRDTSMTKDGKVPDYYDVHISPADDADDMVPTFSKAAFVFYGEEGITDVVPVIKGGEEYDE